MLQERKLYLFQQDGTQDTETTNGIQKVNQNYKEIQHSYLMVHTHTITQHKQLDKLNKVMNLLMEAVFQLLTLEMEPINYEHLTSETRRILNK